MRPGDDASIDPLGKGVLPGIRVTSSAQFLVPLSLVQYLGGKDCKDNDFVEDSTVFLFFFVPFRPFFLRERFVSRFLLRKYRPSFWSVRNDVALVICFFCLLRESWSRRFMGILVEKADEPWRTRFLPIYGRGSLNLLLILFLIDDVWIMKILIDIRYEKCTKSLV